MREKKSGQKPVLVKSHRDLRVYRAAFELAMEVFEISRGFPVEERYSLTDQIRRSSRAVCANIAEAWRRRRYPKSFISHLNIAESEASETQVWLEFAVKCSYVAAEKAREVYSRYEKLIASLIGMIKHKSSWTIPQAASEPHERE